MIKTTIIYNCIAVSLVGIILALPFISVPISVSAPGKVRPVHENSRIISLVGGRIVKSYIHINNQVVQEGDTLLVLTSESLRSKRIHQENMRKDYSAQLEDLENLTSKKPNYVMRTGLYRTERSSLEMKLAEIQTQLNLAEKELQRNETLLNAGVIPLSEYEKSLYNHQKLVKHKKSTYDQQIAVWHGKKREIEQQIRSSATDMLNIGLEEENYVIKASITGTITNLQGFTTGSYITQGQHVADISQEESLIAECYVPPSSIGFTTIGQLVRLQIDAYNYNQWGMLDGVVTDIDNNVVINERTGESYFVVRCKLQKDHLSLKNGYQARIGKGNSFTARFYLTDRTLWQLLLDRVDDWFNPHHLSN
ncbi:HlyD family secretion protein [Sphingobacterium paludis]|uniref:HlyD family secretion protein n=1 Tax=Sphingobacterium paludis TaxID=1476465 RepID=A0A4R7D841_9SPHI|nr:HlyD family efflux transporter periplasmic adaptor subunit [Sphingobacterium paludis]TDS16075.1 HlyD family secretion protein [Sphingobacterium paludis]